MSLSLPTVGVKTNRCVIWSYGACCLELHTPPPWPISIACKPLSLAFLRLRLSAMGNVPPPLSEKGGTHPRRNILVLTPHPAVRPDLYCHPTAPLLSADRWCHATGPVYLPSYGGCNADVAGSFGRVLVLVQQLGTAELKLVLVPNHFDIVL